MDIMKLNSAETEALVLKNLKHQSMKSTIYLNGEFLIVYMNKAAEDLFWLEVRRVERKIT